MTRFTNPDRTRIIEISMRYHDGKSWPPNWSPDWSNDFFDVGLLPYDDDVEAHIVPDLDYCIEMATDWENARGDFLEYDDPDPATENRGVWVYEMEN